MTTSPASLDIPSERRSSRSSVMAALFLLIAGGSVWLSWRTTHTDHQGRLAEPAVAIRIPWVLLQVSCRPDGVHLLGMRYGPDWQFSIQFERQSNIMQSGYQRGNFVSGVGFTFSVLTRTLDRTDDVLSPFAAGVLPYWFLITVSVGMTLYCTGFLSAIYSRLRQR